jgi:hypothetical protein
METLLLALHGFGSRTYPQLPTFFLSCKLPYALPNPGVWFFRADTWQSIYLPKATEVCIRHVATTCAMAITKCYANLVHRRTRTTLRVVMLCNYLICVGLLRGNSLEYPYFPPGLAPIILRLPISVYARAYRLGAHATTGDGVRVL